MPPRVGWAVTAIGWVAPMSEALASENVSVLEGRDGWLFLDRAGEFELFSLYRDESAIEEATIEAWARAMKKRREHFEELGITYQTLVVPELHAVYSDKLPAGLTTSGRTPFQRLAETLDEETLATCVYPLEELRAARAKGDTYRSAEGTWTDRGGWTAYLASVDRLARREPALRRVKESEVDWSRRPALDTDDDTVTAATVQRSSARLVTKVVTESQQSFLVVEQDARDLPSAVVFRDTLLTPAVRFFAESFRRAAFVSTVNALYFDLVDMEQPDVVIHEIRESALLLPPVEPSIVDFRFTFGDLLLGDSAAVADQRRSRKLAEAGRPEEALRASDDVLARVPPTARLMLHRAKIHLQSDEMSAAIEAVRHATTLDPRDGATWCLLGQLLTADERRKAEAAAALAMAARVEPRQPAYWQLAISAALQAENLDLALALQLEARETHPDRPEIAAAAAWVLLTVGRLREAQDAANLAVEHEPENTDYLWQLAGIQIQLRNWQDAGRTVTELGRLKPDDPDVLHYLEALRKQTTLSTPPEGRHDRKR